MCGRYTLTKTADELIEVFDVVSAPDFALDLPRFNIAPTQVVPILVLGPEGRRLGALRWGLVPFWADHPRIGSRLINARSESVRTKPSFREAFQHRRCLIPADGFYEWQVQAEGGPKTPYWIHRPGQEPFTLAGLWDSWRPAEGELLNTFTILTTRASLWMVPLHDRMPVVIGEAERDRWMSRETSDEDAHAMLGPASENYFTAYPVSREVNKPGNDHPVCIESVEA